jgi:hypothetical protein
MALDKMVSPKAAAVKIAVEREIPNSASAT